MRNLLFTLLAALLVSACSQEKTTASESDSATNSSVSGKEDSLKKLEWFIGSWQMSRHDTITRETWTAQADGSYSGTGVTFTAKDTLFKEKLQLMLINDTVVYRAFPGGTTKGTDFKLISASAAEAVFENPLNDFPKRIQYRHPTADSLHARISGPMEGKEVSEDFRMLKVK